MRNKPLLFALVAFPLVCCVVVICLAASSRFTYQHPQGVTMEVRNGRVFARKQDKLEDGKAPKAVVVELTHNFGRMNPLTMGAHAFTIRNEGNAPLLLRQGETSCKCTLGAIDKGEVAPGQETTVRLEWNTGKHPVYSHHAVVHTNDPVHKRLTFQVEGFVREQIGAQPAEVDLGDVVPGEAVQAEVLLYSQTWDSFKIESGESSIEGLTWKATPVERTELSEVEGRCGYRIAVDVPADLAQGDVSGNLQMTVASIDHETGDEVKDTIELPIAGKVLRRLALYGKEIDFTGTIDLGHLKPGTGTKVKLVAKIRDDQKDLRITKVTANPDFIKVSLTPYPGEAAGKGLGYLNMEISPDAPECWYRGPELADIHIEFDHPRITDLDLKVRFAIVGEARRKG